MSAKARREAIQAILAASAVGTQEELAAALRRRGFAASQASISRDIAALGLVKARGRYARAAAAVPGDDPALARIRANVLGTRAAGEHLLVLTTPPGEAAPVALALDHRGWPGVAGTIAGDDTVFVAVESAAAMRELRRRLRRLGVPT